MAEGDTKACGNCGTQIIHVKITKSFQGKTEEKLQWQNVDDKKPHFRWVGEKDGQAQFDCMKPTQQSTTQHAADVEEEICLQAPPSKDEKVEVDTTIEVKDPFQEAELIVRWARDKAYKMVMAEVSSYDTLTQQEKNSLGQKEGMLTRAIIDTTLELRKLNGIKSQYGR